MTTSVDTSTDHQRARIHDLSETGLKLEIPGGFDSGKSLVVDLPYLGLTETRITWNEADFYGVEFLQPISKAAVSASLLRSRPALPIKDREADIAEIPIGDNPSVGQIASLAIELEQKQGITGTRLLGFRKSPDGTINALVLKSD